MDLSFAVHKLATFSEKLGKVHFEGFVHLLIYVTDNKNFVLKYYADMNDAPVTDLLINNSIKTENHLMDFCDYSWQDCPGTGRSTGAYIIFFQGGPIDHVTYVPVTVSQSSAESKYNTACTSGMALAHFNMLIHELLNKNLDILPEESPLIVLESKYYMCMANNRKDTKHTRNIARRVHFVRNGKKCNIHNIDWCEGFLQLTDIFIKKLASMI